MRIELFDARMLEPLVCYLEQHGARAESFLDRVRIPGEIISSGGWVAKKQAYDLTFDIVCQSHRRDSVFAAYLNFEFRHLGPIADAMRPCKTVKEALEVGTRLGNIAYEGNDYFLKIDGDTTWFCYREPTVISAGQQFISDMTLTVYFHLIRQMTEPDWRPMRMLTRGDELNRHRTVENFEDCLATFHPTVSAIAFPTEFLSRRPTWNGQAAKPDETLAWRFGPAGSEPIVETLYRLIASRFPCRKLPTLEQVAAMVGASPATLKRELASAGMSYRRLLDRLRFDAACEMLSDRGIAIKGIAHDLGYSGINNFIRSFRRMTGITPGRYRQQLLGDPTC